MLAHPGPMTAGGKACPFLDIGLRVEVAVAATRNPLRERSNRMVKIKIGDPGARTPQPKGFDRSGDDPDGHRLAARRHDPRFRPGSSPTLEVPGGRGAALHDRVEDGDYRKGNGSGAQIDPGADDRHQLDRQQRRRWWRGGDHASVRPRAGTKRDAAAHAVRVRLQRYQGGRAARFRSRDPAAQGHRRRRGRLQDPAHGRRSRTSSCPRRPSSGSATRHRGGRPKTKSPKSPSRRCSSKRALRRSPMARSSPERPGRRNHPECP